MIRSALLTAFLALALTACSEKPAEEEMANEAPATTTEEAAEESIGESTGKMIDKITDIDIDITGDESAATDDLATAADEMTGGKSE